ncbi:hypothetical protein LCGC14_1033450 [marine sediment metagenome]|uniref:Uncharacterized protein n=1 Tax=marine sediment metagenome TaxID=412755 RepID=A0A0F9NFI8_9ZZZZ
MINNETEQSFYSRRKKARRVTKNYSEQGDDDKEYLKIWQNANPSFKDINSPLSLIKSVSLIFFVLSVVISGYIQNIDLISSTILGASFLIIFLIVFSDDIFSLRNCFSYIFRNTTYIKPFKDIVFWMEEPEPSIIYRSHKKDLIHQAIQIFKVEVIPDKIQAKLASFVISLSSKNLRIPYAFQVVQAPFYSNIDAKLQKKSMTSIRTNIYFSVMYDRIGILTDHMIERLRSNIKEMGDIMKNNLATTFHHYKIELLSEVNLVNALRTFYMKGTTSVATKIENKKATLRNISFIPIMKLALFAIILSSIDIILSNFEIVFWYIIGIDTGIVIFILLIWWREIFFHFTKTTLFKKDNIMLIKPFKNVRFIRFRQFPRTLFLNIEDHLLLGLKILNLKNMFYPRHVNLKEFFEALNYSKLSFGYTLSNYPIDYSEFYDDGFEHIKEGLKNKLLSRKKQEKNSAANEEWLGKRYGMWNIILSLSVHSYIFIETLQKEQFYELEEELLSKKKSLAGSFHLKFNSMDLTELSSNSLLSGYLFSTLKDKKVRGGGSHLNYMMIQGTTLIPFTEVVGILKKGLEITVPAEFNTPLYLENSIVIGKTINTEVWEGEIEVEFTPQQLKNLLITNGIHNKRVLTAMKVVTELIEDDHPCLIFDFDGSWSKIINYFKGTRFEEEILYFKLGSAFTIDPLISDISYDTNNTEYLEYMFDAFGLAFKKDQRTIDIFRNTIRENPEMDLPSIQLELQTQSKWERNPISNSLLSLFSDFTTQDLKYFKKVAGTDQEKIYAYNFVTNEKTVIIDLSLLREANKKIFFSFLILSKIIHYIKSNDDYVVKNIIVPNIDIFFETYYLDQKMSYGKIDTFLEPFNQRGFGMIYLASQIHYLHPNLLTYFSNLISFRATDQRDIATLSTLMNLQESGRGMYSPSRQNAYQIEYLKILTSNKVLIKRSDINQSFPALIEWHKLEKSKKMSDAEIVDFMERRGYNLKNTEKRILEQAKHTLFEAHLGPYINYLEEVTKFLAFLKKNEKIGNLTIPVLKKGLLERIYPKASKKTNKKENINNLRDDILAILIKHKYLVESHRKQPSGSETVRTSYSVGSQFEMSSDDYFESKNRQDVDVNIIEKENINGPDLTQVFNTPPRRYIIQAQNLKKALAQELGKFFSRMFEIYHKIKHLNFKKALKIEHGLIQNYLSNVYRHFNNQDAIVTQNSLNKFLKYLSSVKNFPISYEDLVDFNERYRVINYAQGKIKEVSEEIYKFQNLFFTKINSFLEGKNND